MVIQARAVKNKISEFLKFISAAHITPIVADTARNIGETLINFILGMVFITQCQAFCNNWIILQTFIKIKRFEKKIQKMFKKYLKCFPYCDII
jgi:hypothetical protein